MRRVMIMAAVSLVGAAALASDLPEIQVQTDTGVDFSLQGFDVQMPRLRDHQSPQDPVLKRIQRAHGHGPGSLAHRDQAKGGVPFQPLEIVANDRSPPNPVHSRLKNP